MAEIKNKLVFNTKIDGVDVELAAVRPNKKIAQEAQKIWSLEFTSCLKTTDEDGNSILTRDEMNDLLKKRGIWDDKKEAKHKKLREEVQELTKLLRTGKRGRSRLTKEEGKQIALDIRNKRQEMQLMVVDLAAYDGDTAEGKADNVRFDYMVSQCIVYNNDGRKVFRDLGDYLEKAYEDYASEAAGKLAALLYNTDETNEKNLIENKFLTKYGYVNDDLRLVNEEGHLVSEDGKLIDEEGYYVDEKGNRVTVDGEKWTPSDEMEVADFKD